MKSRNHRRRHWILRELDRVGDQRRSAACRGRPEPAPGRETAAEFRAGEHPGRTPGRLAVRSGAGPRPSGKRPGRTA